MSDTAKNKSTGNEKKEHRQEEIIHNELSPGAQLSARRQALNWSIEQVASQLNLAPRQIQAIESDNYAALPGMASARGFIRSYAKLLKVDATPLLQIVAKEATTAEDAVPLRRALPAIRFAESRLSPSGKSSLLARAASVLLLLLLLVGGLLITQQIGMHSILPPFMQFGTVNNLGVLPAFGTVETAAKEAPDTTNEAYAAAEKYPSGIRSGSDESDNVKKSDIAFNDTAVNDAAFAMQPVAVENTVVAPVAIANGDTKNLLTLKLREDSWIEITRSDNSTLAAVLLKAGTTESFKITGPVAVIIGNATGVDATLRGKPIVLKPDAKNNVARLNLK
ncbi:MAG: hypothetical protein A3I66_01750 [Burkholderiales bacterium RIFCSPLOWO2_02_FULL_57_36]|nr:MAG: hypothetical protein A3I66_01750 [Burkholderiales bacterium RIFCSPLOWO2_02_FULL_57_36]